MRLSLPVSVFVSALMVSAALLWVAESQRYALSGDGGVSVRLDRRTGETVMCMMQKGDEEEGHHNLGSHWIAPCTGYKK